MNQVQTVGITGDEHIVGNMVTVQIGNGGDSVWSDNASVLLLGKTPGYESRDNFIGVVKFEEGQQILIGVIPNTDARQKAGAMYVSGGALWMDQVSRHLNINDRVVIANGLTQYRELIEHLPLSVRNTK